MLNLIKFETVTSTQDVARQRIQERQAQNLDCIFANEQTAGRGRFDRKWVSDPGNLSSSTLIKLDCDLSIAPQLSYITALAILKTVLAYAKDTAEDWKLKWPNDLLYKNQKCAGILLETAQDPFEKNVFWMIIGVGVNINHAPKNLPYPANYLQNIFGREISRDDFLLLLGKEFVSWYHLWKKKGFAPIRENWLNYAYKLGEEIIVKHQNSEEQGTFLGLTSEGYLQLKTRDGIKDIVTGDVFGMKDVLE